MQSFLEEVSNETCEERTHSESQSGECDADFFGPALPLHLLKKNLEDKKTDVMCSPTLPDHISKKIKEKLTEGTLPPSEQEIKTFIGPEVPECLKFTQSSEEVEEVQTAALNEEDNFGPSPSLMASGVIATYKFMKSQNLSKETLENAGKSNAKRETWMTELPKKKGVNFGLFPRHFKSRIQSEKESDDSVWTDTPADKKRKESHKKKKDHKEILQMKRLKERDEDMEKLAKKAAKKLKKKQSLLEMHLESMAKNKKRESKKQGKEGEALPQRRPFDRNVDLQIRKFDESQKRAILNKSQLLNDRFAPGQSKFL